MGMTITEKILCAHTDHKEVRPGMLINAKVDIALGNDITAPIAIAEFRKTGAAKVFDKDKVVLVPDHFTPNKDISSAEQSKILRDFAREQGLTYYYEVGEVGVEHALLPEQGVALPGDLIIGADSHTCTYGALGAFSTGVGSTDFAAAMLTGEAWFKVPETIKVVFHGSLNKWVSGKDLILHLIGLIGVDGALYRALEFCGETVSRLTMADRFTIANMVVEAGAKNGIFAPDRVTKDYVEKRARRSYKFYASDRDAEYAQVIEIDVTQIEPQVAFPFSPGNGHPISDAKDIKIDQVVIGTCTNGWFEDMKLAASVLKGRQIHPHVRVIVIPGSVAIQQRCIKEGLAEIFIDSGCVFSTSTCGPCIGGHMGVLGPDEVCVSTTNRNFVGRMGDKTSKSYLVNPAIAAASAIAGQIMHPDNL